MWMEICWVIICHAPAIVVNVLPPHFSDTNNNDDGKMNQGMIAWAFRASMQTLPGRKITVRSSKPALNKEESKESVWTDFSDSWILNQLTDSREPSRNTLYSSMHCSCQSWRIEGSADWQRGINPRWDGFGEILRQRRHSHNPMTRNVFEMERLYWSSQPWAYWLHYKFLWEDLPFGNSSSLWRICKAYRVKYSCNPIWRPSLSLFPLDHSSKRIVGTMNAHEWRISHVCGKRRMIMLSLPRVVSQP